MLFPDLNKCNTETRKCQREMNMVLPDPGKIFLHDMVIHYANGHDGKTIISLMNAETF